MNIFLKLGIAIVVAGSFVAATAASTPRAAGGGGGFETSVDRTNKGDRLESVLAKSTPATAPQHSSMSVGRRPIGCEPAFSPLAEPGRKQFFGRCVS